MPEFSVGDCVALSFNDVGVRSYQGCSCEEPDINFICESADEAPFDCPDDGFYPAAPCSDVWYNCFGGQFLIYTIFVPYQFVPLIISQNVLTSRAILTPSLHSPYIKI